VQYSTQKADVRRRTITPAPRTLGAQLTKAMGALLNAESRGVSTIEPLEPRSLLATATIPAAQLDAVSNRGSTYVDESAATVGFLDDLSGNQTHRAWARFNLPSSSSLGGQVALIQGFVRVGWSFATSGRLDDFDRLAVDLLGSNWDSPATISSSLSTRYAQLGSGTADQNLGIRDLTTLSGTVDIPLGPNGEFARTLEQRYGQAVYLAFREDVEETGGTPLDDSSLVTITSATMYLTYAPTPTYASPSQGASRPQLDLSTFSWTCDTSGSPSNNTIWYEVQWSQSTTFTGSTFRSSGWITEGSTSTQFGPPDDGTWYWRVRATKAGQQGNAAYTTDWSGGSNPRSFTATNDPPTVSSLQVSPGSAHRGDTITLEAVGVDDDDGVPDDVYFYRDSNASGSWDSGDEEVGRDTSLDNGWRVAVTLDPAWGIGTKRFFARVQDDDDGWSNPVSNTVEVLNRAPSVGGVSASPSPVAQGTGLTLIAQSVLDPDQGDSVSRVEFWRDSNFNGILDAGDQLLSPADTNGTDGWTWLGSANFSVGQHRFFAKAVDQHGASGVSPPAIVNVDDDLPPTISGLTISPSLIPAVGTVVTLTATGVWDDYGVVLVQFYRGDSSNPTLLLPPDTNGANGWTWTGFIVPPAGATSLLFSARAQDTSEQWSNWPTATVPVQPGDDTTPPTHPSPVSVLTPPSDSTPTFQWNRPADPGANATGVNRYYWQVKSGPTIVQHGSIDSVSTPVQLTLQTPLASGGYTLFVRARDGAGNWSLNWGGVAFSVSVTTVGPPTQVMVDPDDDWGPLNTDGVTSLRAPRVKWNMPAILGPGISHEYAWQVHYAGGGLVPGAYGINIGTNVRLPALADGAYRFYVRAQDITGNWSPSWASIPVRIDATAPSVPGVLSPPSGSTLPPLVTFAWNQSTDSAGGTGVWGYHLEVFDSSNTRVLSVYSRQLSESRVFGAGTYSWRVRSLDLAGAFSAASAQRWFTIL
jgi:hypothetical protein